jgi:hypothetical protein
MNDLNYGLVGKRVRVHLYDHGGRMLGALEGRVADVAADVPVGKDAAGTEIKKDLAYVVDIEPLKGEDGEDVPFKNSAGSEGEGWFAVQDLTVVEDGPRFSAN